jgi:phage-related protein
MKPVDKVYQNKYTLTIGLQRLEVRFYASERGHEPVRDWLLALPADGRVKVELALARVQFGWPVGMPLVRKLQADLWEARTRTAVGQARILFTVLEGSAVLLHGFVKKSQKIPRHELALARGRLARLLRAEVNAT